MITSVRIPILLVARETWVRKEFRKCIEGTRYSVWTDTPFSDHLLPLHNTLNPRLTVIDLAASPKSETGATPLVAIRSLLDENPKAAVIVSYTFENKYLLSSALDAGARGHILRPFTRERVLQGIGMALTNHEGTQVKRRMSVRVPARLAVYYKEPPGHLWNRTRVAQTEDVCEAGARVRVGASFRPGEEMKLEVRLTQATPPLKFRARVANCEQVKGFPLYDVGFSFVEAENRDRLSLKGFVHQRIAEGSVL